MYNREEAEKEKSKQKKKHENASIALLIGIVITFYSAISLIGILANTNIGLEFYIYTLMVNFLLFGLFIFFLGFFTLYPRREEEEKKVIFLLIILTGTIFVVLSFFGMLSILFSLRPSLVILIILLFFSFLGCYLIYYGFKKYRYDWAGNFY